MTTTAKTGIQIGSTVIAALLIRLFIIAPYHVPTGSMTHTLLAGDCVIGFKLAYGFRGKTSPERNDVVIFQRPDDPSKVYTKRIVAIGGDTLEIRSKQLFINGNGIAHGFAYFSDPHILMPGEGDNRDNVKKITVPQGYVYILGDNRDNSLDSRVWGSIDADTIEAKVLFIYWSKDKTAGKWRLNRIGRQIK